MTVFDFVVVFILGLCFLFSFYKGMVREVFSFVGYLAGYVLAMDYYDELASMFQAMVSQEIMARIAEFKIIFVVVKIVVALFIFFIVKIAFDLLGRLIRKSMEGSAAISFPDRIIGGTLGILKGLVIVAIIMFPLSLFQGGYEKVTQGSVLSPYLEKIIHVVSQESYGDKIFDKIPEILIDGIQKNFEKISDLDKITQDMKTKKDKILKEIQGAVKNEKKEKILEKYTEEDKNKLNDLLETFSGK